MTPLSSRIEALLFAEGGSLSIKKIAQLLDTSPEDVTKSLPHLRETLAGRGISLVVSDTEASLVVSADARDAVKAAYERELGAQIGEASLEVLSILLYRGPSTRAEIDYIRGVNTSSTIRTLLSRGLVERAGNPADGREYLYRPTVELLAHLGVNEARQLPEYDKIRRELAAFEQSRTEKETGPFDTHGNTGSESTERADHGNETA